MICVEVHENNVLSLRNNSFKNTVSNSVKHETVNFLFSDNWNDYQKTAVFTAKGGEPINVVLEEGSPLCLSADECYIPAEVLLADSFTLSVFGVCNERLATSTKEKIEVLESGYALGDKPNEPTPDQYSQIINLLNETKQLAQSVRNDADNGLFKGAKGDKGEKGDKGTDGLNGVGVRTVTEGEIFNDLENNTAGKNAHAEGRITTASGNASHAEGNQTKALGNLGSHAEGLLTEALGDSAHAEGQATSAEGDCAHAEGSKTRAVGNESHAEGISTSAKGSHSHAEGYGCAAIGAGSHAEGGQTSAWGKYSHAGGEITNAYGDYSTVLGIHTNANFKGQVVVGRYNKTPEQESLFTIGSGTSDNNKKNAFNVYTDGTVEICNVKFTESDLQKLLQLIQ